MTYSEGKEKAIQEAQEWQAEATEESKSYSYGELIDAGEYFHKLGKRYGLLREFAENGIPC